MKRYLFSITIILFCNSLFAQTKYTNEELKLITDSILKEGELLYKLEKSSWWTSDFAKNDNKIKKEMKTYFSYVCNDTIKCIILNEKKTKVLLEAGFIDAFNQPEYSNTEKRDLTPLETKLLKVRKNIADSLTNPEYDLQFFSKYPFNTTLVPASDGGYRFYIFSGVNVANVIPFGNDEQFNCDSTGKICSFVKIHPKLIATSTKGPNGEYLVNISHNHDATAPFITSTDICIFLLYGKLYGIESLSVYSSSLNVTFKYSWLNNTISIINN